MSELAVAPQLAINQLSPKQGNEHAVSEESQQERHGGSSPMMLRQGNSCRRQRACQANHYSGEHSIDVRHSLVEQIALLFNV